MTERRRWPSVLLALGLAVGGGASGGETPRLFESQAALAVTLHAPWRQVLRASKQPQRHPAVLAYTDAQGRAHRLQATVETRGITRLQVCGFPPLRIRFAAGAARGTDFAGQRALKMVTHCQDGQRYERYYVKELLAYRIYGLLAPVAFRVRPLDITYLDATGGRSRGPHFAFLIEDIDEVARRGGLAVAREARFAPADYDAMRLARFSLFQFLLGNTDWEVLAGPQADACCHNVRVLGGESPRRRIPVPYDFDSAGLVDAPYAAPHERLPIREVTQRLYRGFCVHNPALQAARQEFIALRPAILALVRDEPRLDPQNQRAMVRYIEEFYAVLGDEPRFAREITAQCRK